MATPTTPAPATAPREDEDGCAPDPVALHGSAVHSARTPHAALMGHLPPHGCSTSAAPWPAAAAPAAAGPSLYPDSMRSTTSTPVTLPCFPPLGASWATNRVVRPSAERRYPASQPSRASSCTHKSARTCSSSSSSSFYACCWDTVSIRGFLGEIRTTYGTVGLIGIELYHWYAFIIIIINRRSGITSHTSHGHKTGSRSMQPVRSVPLGGPVVS